MESRFDAMVDFFWSMEQDTPFAALLDELAAELPAGLRALDVGSGPGGLLSRLPARGFAADVSLGMCRRALDHGFPAVTSDAMRLPIASGALDAVVTTNLLHLVPDAGGALQEAARVLRPGGVLLLLVPGPRLSEPALRAYLEPRHGADMAERLSGWGRSAEANGRFTEDGLRALLGAAGFADPALRLAWDGLALLGRARRR